MRKKILFLFVVIIFLLIGRYERETKEEHGDSTLLWVLTEASTSDGMNLQAEIIAERLEDKYDGLTVFVDVLPIDDAEREIRLKQLRTQIMSGEGPDIYLLPTGNTLILDDIAVTVEPLFFDVNQAALNGIFIGIQDFYDVDVALNKDALKPEVMDAGLWDNQRLVLPLRFDLPLILSTPKRLADFGLNPDQWNVELDSLIDIVLSQNQELSAAYGLQIPSDMSLLPTALDYYKGEVCISTQEMADYLSLYQRWKVASDNQEKFVLQKWGNVVREDWLVGGGQMLYDSQKDYLDRKITALDISFFYNIETYICYESDWYSAGFPLCTSNLGSIIDAVVISKAKKQELLILPLLNTNGEFTATVKYYGAVGSSCGNPKLAYEFLRQFLTEEFQFEIYRPRIEKKGAFFSRSTDPQSDGLVENSWPVRTNGATSSLWDNRRYQVEEIGGRGGWKGTDMTRKKEVMDASLRVVDDDIPALKWEIDKVRFPVVLENDASFETLLALLIDEYGAVSSVDIDELAKNSYQNLWWHLAEG